MLTLLGTLFGFLSSGIPHIVDFFKDKSDKKHELEMMDKQIQAQKELQTQKLEEVKLQASIEEIKDVYEFAKQPMGFKIMEALNASVRPLITYGFFFLFVYLTVSILIFMANASMNAFQIKEAVWDEETKSLFAAIISFWFGSRQWQKTQK